MLLPAPETYLPLIELAWREDYQHGDITSEATLPSDSISSGKLLAREPGTMAAMAIVKDILSYYDKQLTIDIYINDSKIFHAGQILAEIHGNTRSLLACERVVLNFLQRLSAIATMTSKYVKLVSYTQAKICDTRKTTPGWRSLEKYAVRCGGGTNHRNSLFDAVLVKDNHLAALKGENIQDKLTMMCQNLLSRAEKPKFIEVEVDTLEQLAQILKIEHIDIILLDNMTNDQMLQAVEMRNSICSKGKRILLEASGGITIENVSAIAETGVDRISIGALTHSVRNLDIALDM